MSDEPHPLVSIGMPVRNNQATLAQALRSIVHKTFTDWELLLIDDGSTDDSPAIASRFADADGRIRVFSDGQQLGLPERLNQAIAASRGTYFARMDGDDVSYPRRLERQIEYLRRYPSVDLVGCGAIVFRGNGTILGKLVPPERHSAICAHVYSHIPIMHPTFLGRINFFREFGYRSSAHRCEDQDLLLRGAMVSHRVRKKSWDNMLKAQDQDLLLRACSQAHYANVPEILLGYREELRLSKILKTRHYVSRSFFSVFIHRGQPFSAVAAVALQALKGMVDIIAISSRLNYHLLWHRARPIIQAERLQWEDVWAKLINAEGA